MGQGFNPLSNNPKSIKNLVKNLQHHFIIKKVRKVFILPISNLQFKQNCPIHFYPCSAPVAQ
jgi:hypothetical protein